MSTDVRNTVRSALFKDPAAWGAYAILDGASVKGLLERLGEDKPEHTCLYSGTIAPDLAMCAPYLVRLQEGSAFTEWLLGEGWGKHWGVFAVSAADLQTVRKHCRQFLVVRDADGKSLYFRYYDPRVLRTYLPTCNPGELRQFFGCVTRYIAEAEQSDQAAADVFERRGAELIRK
ncbi:MAG: DUF4123 domain-containing protein [Phycisphaerales bacterium]